MKGHKTIEPVKRDELTERLGHRLRQMRLQRELSLDALAQLTGVSKPMLGQIERGASSPTVTTLWKIATGLDVPFTAFFQDAAPVQLIRADQQTALYEADRQFQVFSTYTAAGSPVESFRVILLPGCRRVAEPHTVGVLETLTVYEGRLTVTLPNETCELQAGDALNFVADVEHTYENKGATTCVIHMSMVYTGGQGRLN